MTSAPAVDLYWLPLGAGGHSVRLNGIVYEAVAAAVGRAAGSWPTELPLTPERVWSLLHGSGSSRGDGVH